MTNAPDYDMYPNKIELLYKSIEDNQNTIRFTDTKAGALIVLSGTIAALTSTIIKDYLKFIKKLFSHGNWEVLFHYISVLASLGSIFFLVWSIYLAIKAISPKSGPVKSVRYDLANGVPNLFYLCELSPAIHILNVHRDKEGYFKLQNTTSELNNSIDGLSKETIQTILIFELQKVSFIRELKIQRVKKAANLLMWAGGIFIVHGILIATYYIYT